ncbi:hypothetical protein OHT93_35625 [Streptomyces sp. NBC_00191]
MQAQRPAPAKEVEIAQANCQAWEPRPVRTAARPTVGAAGTVCSLATTAY